MLTNEHNLLHAVAVLLVPVGSQGGIALHHLGQLVFGHRGEPLACLTDAHLLACLLEEVAHVHLVVEIADALGADHALGPLVCHEVIKHTQFHGAAAIVHKRTDAIFLGFTLVVMMVMMVVMMVMLVLIVMLMLIVVVVIIIVVMVVMLMLIVVVIIVVFVLFAMALYLLNPGCRSSYLIEVKHVGIQNLIEADVAVVALDNLGLGLQGADDGADASQANIGVGYGYNWVPLRGLVVNVMAMPTVSVYNRVKAYKYETNYDLSPKEPVDNYGDWNKETRTWANGKTHKPILMANISNHQFDYWEVEPEVNHSMLQLNLDLRLGIAYNWSNYFIGAQAQYNNFNYKNDHGKVNIFDAYARVSFGVRL